MSHFARPMHLTLILTLGAALGATAIACSSSSDGDQPGVGSGGDGGPGSDGAVGDGGKSSDGGTGSEASAGPVKVGYVTLAQTTAGPSQYRSASAGFYTTVGALPSGTATCTKSTQGACEVTTCTTADAGPGPVDAGEAGTTSSTTFDSAGTITISSTTLGASSISLSPDAKNMYTTVSGAGAVFAGGEAVKVKAAGATVPAFETTANAPSDITVTVPAFSTSMTSFSKSSNLAMTWTGGGAGDVRVSMSSASGSKSVIIACMFTANAGTGTVPTAALSELGTTGVISITPQVASSVQAGAYAVSYTMVATGQSGTFTAN